MRQNSEIKRHLAINYLQKSHAIHFILTLCKELQDQPSSSGFR